MGARRSFVLRVGATILLAITGFVAYLQMQAGAADDDAAKIRDELAAFAGVLDGMSVFDELNNVLPVSNRTAGDVLKLAEIFDNPDAAVNSIKEKLASASDSLGDIQAKLDEVDALDPAGVDTEITGPGGADQPLVAENPTDSNLIDVVFKLTTSGDVTIPLSFANDLITLGGPNGFPVHIDVHTTVLHFQLDKTVRSNPATAGQALYLRMLPGSDVVPTASEQVAPALSMSVTSSDADLADISTNLGFSAVSVDGKISFDVGFAASLDDPDDNDKITADEFRTTALADLLALALIPKTQAVVATLQVDSDLIGGTPDATITQEADIVDPAGDPPPAFVIKTPTSNPPVPTIGDFRNFTAQDALEGLKRLAAFLDGLQATGKLDFNIPFVGGSFSDVLELAEKLTGDPNEVTDGIIGELTRTDDPNTPQNEAGDAIFGNIQAMANELMDKFGLSSSELNMAYDSAARILTFNVEFEDGKSESFPLKLDGIDILSGITTSGTAALGAGYAFETSVGFDFTAQPREGANAPIGSCTDSENNDGDADTDAADSDCAGVKTLEERVFLDVGTGSGGTPGAVELKATASAKACADATATIGMLEVAIDDASMAIGKDALDSGTLCAGSDQPTPAALDIDVADPADGRLTIRDLFNAMGPTPGTATIATHLDAAVDGTIPVTADLSGLELGGGAVEITGSFDGSLADVAQLVNRVRIDGSGLRAAASDLIDFAPCGNAQDDDGDNTVNDGCPAAGPSTADTPASPESGDQCAPGNTADDDSDGTVNDGCAAVDETENTSKALLDKVLDVLLNLANRLEADAETGASPLATALSTPLPVVGKSLNDLLSLADTVRTLADDISQPSESTRPNACAPGNTDDEDGDDIVNDGCPVSGAAAEEVCDDTENNDAADPGDNLVNDGCSAVSATLQKLEGQLEERLQGALDAIGLPESSTPTVDVGITLDGDDDLVLILNITGLDVHHRTDLALDLESLLPGQSLATASAAGGVNLEVDGSATIGLGLDLDTFQPFLLGETGVDVDALVDVDDIKLNAALGPLQVEAGNEGSPGSLHAAAGFQFGVAGSAGEKRYFAPGAGQTGISFDHTLAGSTPAGCSGNQDLCLSLPLFLNNSPLGDGSPANDHVLSLTIDDIFSPSFNFAWEGSSDVVSIIGSQMINMLVGLEGVQNFLNGIESFLNGELLGFKFPIIGDQMDEAARFIDDLEHGRNGASQGLLDAMQGEGNPLENLLNPTAGEVATKLQTYANKIGTAIRGSDDPNNPGKATGILRDTDGDGDEDASDFKITVWCGPDSDKKCDVGGEADTVADNGALDTTTSGGYDDGGAADNCTNDTSDDGPDDDRVNDGCPAAGPPVIESGAECRNGANDDAATEPDTPVLDDGCPAVASEGDGPEGTTVDDPACTDGANTDGDDDDVVDDGCPAVPEAGPPAPEDADTECEGNTDDDDDGFPNDGCPEKQADGFDITGATFNAKLGQAASMAVPVNFDIGIPGLGLATQGNVEGGVGWELNLGFGVTKKHGFFVETGDPNANPPEPELKVFANVSPPNSLEGNIGFVKLALNSPPGASSFEADFDIDILDPTGDGRLTLAEIGQLRPSDHIKFSLNAKADVDVGLVTSIAGTGATLPQLKGDFELDWHFHKEFGAPAPLDTDGSTPDCPDNADQIDVGAITTNCLNLEFGNMRVNVGSFVNNFLDPLLKDVKKFTEPFDPVIKKLNEPIPVLSDLAGQPITLLTLIETFGPSTNDLRLIFDIIRVIDFVNNFGTGPDGIEIPIGAGTFDLAGSKLQNSSTALPSSQARQAFSNLAQLDGAGALLTGGPRPAAPGGNTLDEQAPNVGSGSQAGGIAGLRKLGITFPIYDEPGKLMGLLFGQDVDLVVWRPQGLKAGFSYSQKFGPIWAVPPVFLEVGGSASIEGRFGLGYDTEGLRKVITQGAGPEVLLQGLFLTDWDEAGRDVNEVQLRGELFANAQVSVLIFSAGAQGSVFANLGIDIDDANNDGKLKFAEAADILSATGSPLCLFRLVGDFGVRISVFAEVDLFFWSQRWDKTLADIIIFKFVVECADPGPPTLAHAEGSELVLNLGAHRGARGPNTVGKNEINENFSVTMLPGGAVEVSALGFIQRYPGSGNGSWTKIRADGHDPGGQDGHDVITMLDGAVGAETKCNDAVNDDASPVDQVVNDGCPKEGDAGESPSPPPPPPATSPQCGDSVDNDGDGKVNDGCPTVGAPVPFTIPLVVDAGSGNDQITGGLAADTVDGNGGNDTVNARNGDNDLDGGAGNDKLGGGDNADTIAGGDNDDSVDGAGGGDVLSGGGGHDNIVGGLSTAQTQVAPGGIGTSLPPVADQADTIEGGSGRDIIDAGAGGDTVNAGPDPDRVNGADGNDTINGGDDVNDGCGAAELDDILVGNDGADQIDAGEGDDIVVGGNAETGKGDTGDPKLHGGGGCDLIVGDNATFDDPNNPRAATLVDPSIGGADGVTNLGITGGAVDAGGGTDEVHGQKDGDRIKGGAENDKLYGEDGADVIDGDGGDDLVSGAAGDDDLTGGDGNDKVLGDVGLDFLLGDEGSVARNATPAKDDDVSLTGGSGIDELRGGGDNDALFGQGGDDKPTESLPNAGLFGDSGDEEMYGGDGADLLRGGIGQDYAFGQNGADDVYGEADDDRLVGGSKAADAVDNGLDRLFGGEKVDVLVGDNGEISTAGVETLTSEGGPAATLQGDGDELYGEPGADRLFGEAGADKLYGGPDDDYLEGNAAGDELNGEGGEDDLIGGGDTAGMADGGDTMSGGATVDYLAGDNASITRGQPPATDAYGAKVRAVTVHDLDADPAGISGVDTMAGDDGVDVLFGGGDGDAMHGNANDDHLEGNGGDDRMWGDAGQDDLIGGTTQDGGGHPDGNDKICGPTGQINGSTFECGTETEHDAIAGDNASITRPPNPGDAGKWFSDDLGTGAQDVVRRTVALYDVATTGQPEVAGHSGNDELYGRGGYDVAYGQGGDDTIEGGDDDDYLQGGNGEDTVRGGHGNDDLVGGTGRAVSDAPASAGDGRLDAENGSDADSVADKLYGGDGDTGAADTDDADAIAADNATILRGEAGQAWQYDAFSGTSRVRRSFFFYDVGVVGNPAAAGTSGGDLVRGEDGEDLGHGQGSDDDIEGNDGDDELQGNAGADSIKGQAGNDDIIGGTGAINGDDAAAGNVAAGRLDGAETMDGGAGFDFMTGDNAVIRRVVDDGQWLKNTFNDGVQHLPVFLVDINSPDEAVVSGGDTVSGSTDDDVVYGQGSDDTVHGNAGSDYLEGNASNDVVYGDEGEDDVLGGTGRVNNDPAGGTQGRFDGVDHLYGDTDDTDGTADGSDADAVVGDNSVVERPLVESGDDEGQWSRNSSNGRVVRVVRQLDVAAVGSPPGPSTSGGDHVWGSSHDDVLYGQGGGDTVFGGAGDDDVEGNAADDVITGGPGQDDILGGTGPTTSNDTDTAVDGRLDGNDLILGDSAAEDGTDDGDGADVVAADNGVIVRPLDDGKWKLNAFNGEVARVVTMKDVATTTTNAGPGTSGADTVWGSANDDVLYGQGGNDELHGGAGQDDVEGNAANDHVYGDGAEDDLIGGTGPNPSDESAAAAGRLDGDDVVDGGDDHDQVLGDNGSITRTATWEKIGDYGHFPTNHHRVDPVAVGSYTRTIREVAMPDSTPGATDGSDLLIGGNGDDELFGQFDDSAAGGGVGTLDALTRCGLLPAAVDPASVAIDGDLLCGGGGEDAIMGDQATIVDRKEAGRQKTIKPNAPFIKDTIFVDRTFSRLVTLTQIPEGGNDVLLGGADTDSMHAGAGDDYANAHEGDDRVFGADGDDVMWGGVGDDHLYGGYNNVDNGLAGEFLDVKPRSGIANFPNDPAAWFLWAPDDPATTRPDATPLFDGYADFDHIYGGWDQDALQANEGDNGPAEGDRLLDWVGAYNIFYLCPGTYGEYVSTRQLAPGMAQYLIDQATGDGAVDVGTGNRASSSGFDELALVYTTDAKHNQKPPHPDTPGHFVCD